MIGSMGNGAKMSERGTHVHIWPCLPPFFLLLFFYLAARSPHNNKYDAILSAWWDAFQQCARQRANHCGAQRSNLIENSNFPHPLSLSLAGFPVPQSRLYTSLTIAITYNPSTSLSQIELWERKEKRRRNNALICAIQSNEMDKKEKREIRKSFLSSSMMPIATFFFSSIFLMI